MLKPDLGDLRIAAKTPAVLEQVRRSITEENSARIAQAESFF